MFDEWDVGRPGPEFHREHVAECRFPDAHARRVLARCSRITDIEYAAREFVMADIVRNALAWREDDVVVVISLREEFE